MKHYKNPETNEIFAFELDGSQDHLIPENYIPITQNDLQEIIVQKDQLLFEKRSYAEKRAAEYPPIVDYIDGIVKGDEQQIKAYIDACLAVKMKYPKPSA